MEQGAQALSGPISSFPAGRGPGERHGESDSEETREDISILDAGPVPGMIPDTDLPNRYRGTHRRCMWRSRARITPPPLVPSPHSQKLGPGYFPSPQPLDQPAEATLHLSQPYSPTLKVPTLPPSLRLDSPQTIPHTSEGAARGSPRLPCLLSASSHPRAALGVRRNPSRPSSWENDLQGWGPQASVQAVPINIKKRGCPGVLPGHVLSWGQALASARCQAAVPHHRVPPVGTGSLCCCTHCTALTQQQGG